MADGGKCRENLPIIISVFEEDEDRSGKEVIHCTAESEPSV